MRTTIYHCF